MSKLADRRVCLNVCPVDPQVVAALKARAALQREPLHRYVSRILRAHLAEVPAEPAPAPERTSV
jgi:hypothetical protein